MKRILLFASLVLINTCYIVHANLMNTINTPNAAMWLERLTAARISALMQPSYDITTELNGDEDLPLYAGSFTKGLEHDATTGLLTNNGVAAFQQLLLALSTGLQANYNAITLAAGSSQLKNPQAAFARSLVGTPNCDIPLPKAYNLSSDDAAADIIEVYLQAIARDVQFEDYGTGANTDEDTVNGGSITNNAAAILTALGDSYKGPKVGGAVTAQTLFRGSSAGDLVGPYISQFWYLPTHLFYQNVEQPQYVPVAQNREFGVAWTDFVAIENGGVPRPYNNDDFVGQRHIITQRDCGTCVHFDGPGEFFYNAINILFYNRFPLSPVFPYNDGNITKECSFITMNISDISACTLAVNMEGLMNAWAHKWRGNRRLRPEAMGGLIHRAKVTGTNPYNLADVIFGDIAGINFLDWVLAHNQIQSTIMNDPLTLEQASTYLLAQMYPEGSPLHPTEPSGHATVAGACSTIIKAFVNDQALIVDYVQPVKPDPNDPTQLINLTEGEGANLLTVAGELDKLASNIAMARDAAGVHYRSDGEKGILLGEQLAINWLRDHARVYTEQGFTGFELTKRDGTRIRITDTEIIVIS